MGAMALSASAILSGAPATAASVAQPQRGAAQSVTVQAVFTGDGWQSCSASSCTMNISSRTCVDQIHDGSTNAGIGNCSYSATLTFTRTSHLEDRVVGGEHVYIYVHHCNVGTASSDFT